ncbi:MAG: polyprenyl synthetase family protein [Proteobacteria bacterium]|nr:polyprenyl synthetase family protein [Pseudomonadota bacterium]
MDQSLPNAVDLAGLLGRGTEPGIAAQVEARLVAPARELLGRRSKSLRGRLVAVACDLIGEESTPSRLAAVEKAAAAMELLHAGSLIIDDIQDGSPQRRGGPSLHLVYGVPSALCTGNWLYFWPMRLLADLGLDALDELRVLKCYNNALEKAHYGQALDLSVKVDALERSEVSAYCKAVIAWKTGTITGLAMSLGAIVGGADAAEEAALRSFGERFGMALQMFDDLGDLLGRIEPSKRYEDLRQRKPNAVWALAAELSDDQQFAAFRRAVAQVDSEPQLLAAWLEAHEITAHARQQIDRDMTEALLSLQNALGVSADHQPLRMLRQLAESLIDAY